MWLAVMNSLFAATSLILCPDCEKPVSRRALMCPNCGLSGEVIAEHSNNILELPIGDSLDIDCDGVMSVALPVEMEGRRFAVLPLDPVLGASQVRLWHRGNPVVWSVPELATDAPIVRLQIASTNLNYWVLGGDFAFDGTCGKPNGNKVFAVVSPLMATNAFELSNREWQVLQPRQMKAHGRQFLKMLKGESLELPQHTHPYFKMIESMKKKENMK